MKDISTKNLRCILCNSNKLSNLFSLGKTPIADNYFKNKKISISQKIFKLSLIICNDCKHVQLSDIINPNLLFDKYKYQSSFSKSLIEHFDSYSATLIKRFIKNSNDYILDIGSNDGSFLKFFQEKNIKILGIDPAKKISSIANKNGILTINSFLNYNITNKILKKYSKPKIISANNVYAHSQNLIEMTACIKKLLKQNGVFVFEVSYLMNIIKYKLFDTIYHEHLSYHHLYPLSKLFKKFKLTIFDVKVNKSKGGSLRCFVCHQNFRKINKSYFKFISQEHYFNRNYEKVFHNFNLQLQKNKLKIKKFLEHKKVWGFGASATVTTFVYFFGIKNYLKGIFDDNKTKEGLYLPFSDIMIYHSNKIKEIKPSFIIVLPWVYSNQIISKNMDFIESGGTFILPFPILKIINHINIKNYLKSI